MPEMFFGYVIYQMRNPVTRKVMWVGKAKCLADRIKTHQVNETNRNLRIECVRLRSEGYEPLFEVIEPFVKIWLVCRREGFWIRLLAEKHPIHNINGRKMPVGKEATMEWQHPDEKFYKALEDHEWREFVNS